MPKKFKYPPGITSQAVIVITELETGRLIVASHNDNKSLSAKVADLLVNLSQPHVEKACGKTEAGK